MRLALVRHVDFQQGQDEERAEGDENSKANRWFQILIGIEIGIEIKFWKSTYTFTKTCVHHQYYVAESKRHADE